MEPKRPRFPRLRLNPAFREAVRNAMVRGYPSFKLAKLGGWPHSQSFSNDLHDRVFVGSPLVLKRFARVADVIGFPRAEMLMPETAAENTEPHTTNADAAK